MNYKFASGTIAGPLSTPEGSRVIVYAAFKGMGDLLNAAPVILEELDRGSRVILLIFPGFSLQAFIDLIDFGTSKEHLRVVELPFVPGKRSGPKFFAEMQRVRPDVIWISPHAPREASSWKIPLLLWIMKKLFWPNSILVGCDTERMSRLFDLEVPIDRALPLMEREWLAYSMFRGSMSSPKARIRSVFKPAISDHRALAPRFDLLIHPGANVANRRWPYERFADVVRQIPSRYKIGVLGLKEDVEQARSAFPADRSIEYISGTLEEALATIAAARVLLALDSGNVHFANFLDIPAVGIFGKSDPASIVGSWGSVLPIYERKFSCQPCGRTVCSQREVYCMNAIEPRMVAQVLIEMLERPRIAPRNRRYA